MLKMCVKLTQVIMALMIRRRLTTMEEYADIWAELDAYVMATKPPKEEPVKVNHYTCICGGQKVFQVLFAFPVKDRSTDRRGFTPHSHCRCALSFQSRELACVARCGSNSLTFSQN